MSSRVSNFDNVKLCFVLWIWEDLLEDYVKLQVNNAISNLKDLLDGEKKELENQRTESVTVWSRSI
jgi:hypothetical protein